MIRSRLRFVQWLAMFPLAIGPGCDDSSPTQTRNVPPNVPVISQESTPNQQEETTMPNDAIAHINQQIDQNNIDTSQNDWRLRLPKPTLASFDDKKSYFWVLETNKGSIRIKLMPEVAPMHVTSTIYLTQLGYYDELIFHRVIDGFMAQGGCPQGDGVGGPGYGYGGEFDSSVRHDKPGILSMANTGQPNSDGSQFFLTFAPTPWLDDKHTILGHVVDGMQTVLELEKHGSKDGTPKELLKIQQATIVVE